MTGTAGFGFRAITTLAVVIALGLLGIQFSAPAHAAVTDGKCADNTGLNVVADFQDLGGGVQTRCIENWGGGKAIAGFRSAFKITPTQRWGYSFVCRVNGLPGEGEEDCVDTPPADAYWGYWVASSGSWGYSNLGVSNRNAKVGEWHGLSFSKNRSAGTNPAPRVNPAVPSAPKPKPKPKPSKTAKPDPKPSKPSKPSTPKPKPESDAGKPSKPKPGSSSTGAPRPGASTPAESDRSETESETSDDSKGTAASETEKESDATDSTESSPDADSQETALSEAGGSDPTESTPEESSPSGTVSDTASEKTGTENSGPPTGTLIAIGVIALLAAATGIRHRVRARGASSGQEN